MRNELEKTVQGLMASENVDRLAAISALQGAAAQTGKDDVLEILIEMKRELVNI